VVREGVSDGERGSHRALGVVLVSRRRSEDSHDRVPDELLDRSTVAFELRTEASVVGLQESPDVLWMQALCARCEADQVAEEAGDDLALLLRLRSLLERGGTAGTEARVVGVLSSAARADPHAWRIGPGRARQKALAFSECPCRR